MPRSTLEPVPLPRWSRRAALAALVPIAGLGAWSAIHRVPGLGPALADGARAIVGPAVVARIEDAAYGVDDGYQRLAHGGDPPEAYWAVPAGPERERPAAERDREPPGAPPAYRPADVGPVDEAVAAAGDGVWLGLVDPRHPDEAPRMHKTLLHPDRRRSWSAVSVVAVDLARVELHAVAGRREPAQPGGPPPSSSRTGLIPPADQGALLAAFNGGYKSEHGRYGMKVDGQTLLPPRGLACAIAALDDGSLAIRPWEELAPDEPRTRWWRQTPKCMVDRGRRHAALDDPSDRWGSTVASGTVIRRSAIGLSVDRRVLFVGIADWVTASALASAMVHAGADSVAQLDVNFSYPKLLLLEVGASGELVARPLTKHFEWTEDEYLRKAAERDFFYLTRR